MVIHYEYNNSGDWKAVFKTPVMKLCKKMYLLWFCVCVKMRIVVADIYLEHFVLGCERILSLDILCLRPFVPLFFSLLLLWSDFSSLTVSFLSSQNKGTECIHKQTTIYMLDSKTWILSFNVLSKLSWSTISSALASPACCGWLLSRLPPPTSTIFVDLVFERNDLVYPTTIPQT